MNKEIELMLKNMALQSMVKVLYEKLSELMSEEDLEKFRETVPKRAFFDLFNNCPIPELRNFALDNFDKITGSDGGEDW